MFKKLKSKLGVERDDIIAATHKRYSNMSGDEFKVLKEGWRKEFEKTGAVDDGCGHGLIRFPYDREFVPCHCGMEKCQVPMTIPEWDGVERLSDWLEGRPRVLRPGSPRPIPSSLDKLRQQVPSRRWSRRFAADRPLEMARRVGLLLRQLGMQRPS